MKTLYMNGAVVQLEQNKSLLNFGSCVRVTPASLKKCLYKWRSWELIFLASFFVLPKEKK